MKSIREYFNLKDDKIYPPDVYLGATLAKMKLESGKYCWNILPEQYVKATVTTIEEDLPKSGKILPLKYVTPLSSNYSPWLEDSLDMMADDVQQYPELIGQLSWAVDIGRLDILLETLMLSSYLMMPRVGHLEKTFHIFGYFKTHPKRKFGFNPAHPAIN